MSRVWWIVPAAGQGRRMGGDRPKQYLELGGRPILAHTLERLHEALPDAELCLCLDPDDQWFDPAWVPFEHWRRVPGGAERADSVAHALAAIELEAARDDLVLVHDVARPCVSVSDLAALMATLSDAPWGALLAAPVADTVKRDDDRGHVQATVPRQGLWQAQTPQGFRYGVLSDALTAACRQGLALTDEASAVEAFGGKPRLVAARRDNLKVTHPEDLALAAHILATQAAASSAGSPPSITPTQESGE
ncbi:2-C-methyl-D-erythritol 4-phosphate cytidylyltransferase [Litchfieldella xinjiangensis]|uniref:2-C-methyl-D-erythritol 4-phosphate cytidylyltransferase n=1 Tax=Litchfieldella xinjiangensis TaxID=1166948 RepID=UPI0005BB3FF6|nr:2-C-methyl-D-erythritol 4-phosphate cytidylyltransferase [Halomonas xinjiangensis]